MCIYELLQLYSIEMNKYVEKYLEVTHLLSEVVDPVHEEVKTLIVSWNLRICLGPCC